MVATDPFEITITSAEAGARLDRVLAARGLAPSRSMLQRWIDEGCVTLDGKAARSKDRVRQGSRVVVRLPPPMPPSPGGEDLPLQVLYEDAHICVIDKAAGMVVHPAPGHTKGTLVNALLFRSTVRAEGGNGRPGIVHRLDKDTSGVLVVARTPEAHAGLVPQFRSHTIDRRYLAIALGHPRAEMTFDTLHARHAGDRKRFTSKTDRGKRATTHVKLINRLHGSALVECALETGRTHQIRVHLAEHGFPILGDKVYGRTIRDRRLLSVQRDLGRQALHAVALGFTHPVTGQALRFEAPLPPDLQRAIDLLRLES